MPSNVFTVQQDPHERAPFYASNQSHLTRADIQHAVENALLEDKAEHDVTTLGIFTETSRARGRIFVKEDCVVCGVSVAEETFRYFDKSMKITLEAKDGEKLTKGQTVLRFEGDIRAVLRAERVALNFLAFMSSIATRTESVVRAAARYGVKVLDTRKTIPLLRSLSKYSVIQGGGYNHRHDLAQMGLIKDNHIAQAGSVKAAIEAFRAYAPRTPLEVEVDTLEQLREALFMLPEMVLLDNMESQTMRLAMELIREVNAEKRVTITAEASGGFNLENLSRLEGTGVDFVSLGTITNVIIPPDFSLEVD